MRNTKIINIFEQDEFAKQNEVQKRYEVKSVNDAIIWNER